MSTIQQDFDRIALVSTVSEDGATHNDHYHDFLLRHLPSNCHDVLEIGCGRGAFARRLAERLGAGSAGIAGSPAGQPRWGAMLPAMSARVLALDLSPKMIRIARELSAQFPNIEFQLADVRDWPLPVESFDCIASIPGSLSGQPAWGGRGDPSSPAVSGDVVENEGGTETRWRFVGPRSIRACESPATPRGSVNLFTGTAGVSPAPR